jgi:hypothetical protein
MSEEKDKRACCACLEVKYIPELLEGGMKRERWMCSYGCGNEFVKKQRLSQAEATISEYKNMSVGIVIGKDGYHVDKDLVKIQSLEARLSQAEAENSKFKKFLEWLFAEVFEGSPDGADIQNEAEKQGILVARKVDPLDERYVEICTELDTDEVFFPFWVKEEK